MCLFAIDHTYCHAPFSQLGWTQIHTFTLTHLTSTPNFSLLQQKLWLPKSGEFVYRLTRVTFKALWTMAEMEFYVVKYVLSLYNHLKIRTVVFSLPYNENYISKGGSSTVFPQRPRTDKPDTGSTEDLLLLFHRTFSNMFKREERADGYSIRCSL